MSYTRTGTAVEPSEVEPVMLPLTPTLVVSRDCWIYELQILNDAGSGPITISVTDNQSPPRGIIPAQALPVGAIASLDSIKGRKAPGGIIWQASGAGCTGFISLAF